MRKSLFEEDYTNKYNTKLSPQEESEFQTWAKQKNREKDLFDYDLRGAWKDNVQEAENGHLPDTYKKPNHPTFSDESKYAEKGNHGKWSREGDKDVYTARAGMSEYDKQLLVDYFNRIEKGVKLRFPD